MKAKYIKSNCHFVKDMGNAGGIVVTVLNGWEEIQNYGADVLNKSRPIYDQQSTKAEFDVAFKRINEFLTKRAK